MPARARTWAQHTARAPCAHVCGPWLAATPHGKGLPLSTPARLGAPLLLVPWRECCALPVGVCLCSCRGAWLPAAHGAATAAAAAAAAASAAAAHMQALVWHAARACACLVRPHTGWHSTLAASSPPPLPTLHPSLHPCSACCVAADGSVLVARGLRGGRGGARCQAAASRAPSASHLRPRAPLCRVRPKAHLYCTAGLLPSRTCCSRFCACCCCGCACCVGLPACPCFGRCMDCAATAARRAFSAWRAVCCVTAQTVRAHCGLLAARAAGVLWCCVPANCKACPPCSTGQAQLARVRKQPTGFSICRKGLQHSAAQR